MCLMHQLMLYQIYLDSIFYNFYNVQLFTSLYIHLEQPKLIDPENESGSSPVP